jgi:hypothetical protein
VAKLQAGTLQWSAKNYESAKSEKASSIPALFPVYYREKSFNRLGMNWLFMFDF